MNAGETDLETLVRTMEPSLHPGRFVYSTFRGPVVPADLRVLCSYEEHEGTSVILEEGEALRHKIEHRFHCALITLNVHSDLAAVGFMSTLLTKLAERGIACNVVSAYHHDHLFVPIEQAGRALEALHQLSFVRSHKAGTEHSHKQ